jgi:hypothetical protein
MTRFLFAEPCALYLFHQSPPPGRVFSTRGGNGPVGERPVGPPLPGRILQRAEERPVGIPPAGPLSTIDQVQKFLGHMHLSTTRIYAETSSRALGDNYIRALGGKRWSADAVYTVASSDSCGLNTQIFITISAAYAWVAENAEGPSDDTRAECCNSSTNPISLRFGICSNKARTTTAMPSSLTRSNYNPIFL